MLTRPNPHWHAPAPGGHHRSRWPVASACAPAFGAPVPLAIAAFAFGLSFGVLARSAGLSREAAIVMSATTFAGLGAVRGGVGARGDRGRPAFRGSLAKRLAPDNCSWRALRRRDPRPSVASGLGVLVGGLPRWIPPGSAARRSAGRASATLAVGRSARSASRRRGTAARQRERYSLGSWTSTPAGTSTSSGATGSTSRSTTTSAPPARSPSSRSTCVSSRARPSSTSRAGTGAMRSSSRARATG